MNGCFFVIPIIIFSVFTVLVMSVFGAEMFSTNYTITTTVMSGGGGPMSSANYQTNSTIGQPSCIGRSSRGSIILHAGFWTPEHFDLRPKALPFIPLLLLDE